MFDNEDLVHRYSRADALRDGVLVDVTDTRPVSAFRWR
jgi:hypothetical protein